MAETDRVVRATSFAEAALDKKAQHVVALDVRELTSVADTYLICSGTSDRQTRAIADAVVERAREMGEKALGVEGYDEGRWVLVDLGDVIVHVFQTEVRELYDLERLFSDADKMEIGAAA